MCKYERERKWEAVEAKKEAECILFADEVMWKWESVWVSVCAPACVRERVCARMCERVCVCTHVWERVCACEWEWFSPDKTHNCNVCIYWSEIPIFDIFLQGSKKMKTLNQANSWWVRPTWIVRLPNAKAIRVRVPCQWNQRGRLVGPNVAIYLTSWPYKDLRVT